MVRLSFMVMELVDGEEMEIEYYVRSVRTGGGGLTRRREEHDAWAAYREEPVWVLLPGANGREALLRTDQVSNAPRATLEAALEDLHAALGRLPGSARIVRGEISESPSAEVAS